MPKQGRLEQLPQHRKSRQLSQAQRSLQGIARANLATLRDMQESRELDQLPPVPSVDPHVSTPAVPRREHLYTVPSTMRQTPNPDGSDGYAFEGAHPFALITDHGYGADRIPVEDDHILMTPGNTDYLYNSSGVRIPGWRIAFSMAQSGMHAVFVSARDIVSAELDGKEQSDRQGSAA